jgi:hypothetical protein
VRSELWANLHAVLVVEQLPQHAIGARVPRAFAKAAEVYACRLCSALLVPALRPLPRIVDGALPPRRNRLRLVQVVPREDELLGREHDAVDHVLGGDLVGGALVHGLPGRGVVLLVDKLVHVRSAVLLHDDRGAVVAREALGQGIRAALGRGERIFAQFSRGASPRCC